MRRGKPLRPVSPKRAALSEKRRRFVEEQLSGRRACEAPALAAKNMATKRATLSDRDLSEAASLVALLLKMCDRASSELHEPLTRARAPGAETILDVDNSVAICRSCHSTVHARPKASLLLGLLKSGHAA